jgi:Tol biopolymer transport system component
MIGTTLSHYRIFEKLGAGGMGQVYRAEDTNLNRQVAIKVLPDIFSGDPERLARFEREAKLLASLNHPDIAAIHGLENAGGKRFLVMELVEGETLAQRIAKGPLPVDEALDVCRQIAEGLEAAHEKGVIHRDLKPANVKITPEGKVKILDFGLAKAFQEQPSMGDISDSPTITEAMTQPGVVLGTAAYMSPEQAKGKAVDKRADIWAFGGVLYECLAGKRAFEGETVTETLAAVLTRDPAWDSLPPMTHRRARDLLRRCLKRNPAERLRDIGDARIEIEEAASGMHDEAVAQAPVAPSTWRRTLAVAIGSMLLAGLAAGLAVWSALRPGAPQVTRFTIMPPAEAALSGASVAISPDGKRIAYASANGTQLSVRALDALTPSHLTGLGAPTQPFFSPDGRWIGFFDGLNALKKVPASGGPAMILCGLRGAAPRGAAWSPDGTIIFATDDPATGLWRVSETGGAAELLTEPERGSTVVDHIWPQLLPGGRAVLFTANAYAGSSAAPQLAVLDLGTRALKQLLPGSYSLYAPTGHLIYEASGALRAVGFDLGRLEVIGASVPILETVAKSQRGASGVHIASNGTLVYVQGGVQDAARRLVWVARDGTEEVVGGLPPGGYVIPRLSPDGTKVALDNRNPRPNIWIWDFPRRTMTRFTFDLEAYPFWSRDGRHLAFTSFDSASGTGNLFWRATSGATPAERLAQSNRSRYGSSFAPDGTRLLFREEAGATGLDIAMLTLGAEPRIEPLVQTPFNELNPEVSPDGRWLAYESNESGRGEIYVRPFPDVRAGLWQISTEGGVHPAWAPSGRELFFVAPDGGLMRVPVELEPTLTPGAPARIIAGRYYHGGPYRSYDISPDGRRFLMMSEGDVAGEGAPAAGIVVVLNWFEELKRLVPTGK